MRALLLTDRLDSRGGALRYLLDVAAALSPRHELTVASAGGAPERLGLALPAGVRQARIRGLDAPTHDGRVEAGLREALQRAEVVLVQNVMNPAALALLPPERTLVIVQDHRVFCPGPGRTLPEGAPCATPFERAPCERCLPDPQYRERLLALTAARRDALAPLGRVVLSRYMAQELAGAGMPGAWVIPPAVTVGPPRPDAGEGALLVGRLVAHKGADLGVEAWRLSGIASPLRVVGAGALASSFNDLILNDWQTPQELRRLMRSSRALLFPARWQEPFGIAGLEALAEGLPVIAMVTGGVAEWAQEGVIRVPAGDVGAMAEALAGLEADGPGAWALGEAGRRAVEQRARPEAFAAAWEARINAPSRCAPG